MEWLAEWGRDVRKRQSGLLLLSAHRAKGLEFDDVVILDGSWEKRSRGEDWGAARRLCYVAMTRARRSLALMSLRDRHPIFSDANDEAVLIRSPGRGTSDASDCRNLYRTLDPSEVDLSFAGRLRDGDPSLAALARLKPDDPLLLKRQGDIWVMTDREGTRVCRLARKFSPPPRTEVLPTSVYAITTRFRQDSAAEYQSQLKRDAWSVILPELVFRASVIRT